jgi:hypothetical protein
MVTPVACPGRVPMADHRVESCSRAQQLCMQLRVATFRTVHESCPFIRLKPPPGTFPHPASLRLTAGDAPVCDKWGGEGAS